MAKLYKGVAIREVKISRFEVRSPDGRVMKTASTRAAAQTWVNGYLAALKRAGQTG